MKVTKLTIKNIGIIEDAEIPIDKPEIVFYGDIKQGKSTLLNAVRWVFGGSFPADIIRHGQTEAMVQLEGTEDASTPWLIRREWYRGKDGATRSREIIYTRRGLPVKKPVAQIQQHLNPFLLDHDYLRKMSPLDRSRYLLELFGVDTSEQDAAIREAEQKASELRVQIKAYGNIDLTPVHAVDIAALQESRQAICAEHQAAVASARECIRQITDEHDMARQDIVAKNSVIVTHNRMVVGTEMDVSELKAKIERLKRDLDEAKKAVKEKCSWIKENPQKPQIAYPLPPDLSEFEAVIQTAPDTAQIDAVMREAGATNVRAEQYGKSLELAAAREADEHSLTDVDKTIRDQRKAKIVLLAKVGQQTGIDGLAFKDGGFTFDGTDSSMLSDSQIVRLSQSLSGKYPEGFGLSMIDRGESLGKSVLTLWKEAQDREATVLVSVVGDKPAVIPEQVGAYVVESGHLS